MILNTLNRELNYTDQLLQQHGYSRLQFTNIINSATGRSYNQENLVYETDIVLNSLTYNSPADSFNITNNFVLASGESSNFFIGLSLLELNNGGQVVNNLGSLIFDSFVFSISTNQVIFSQFKFV